nr:ribonuclease H-like domain-containing protein [Tanacetum cinerariifolium]
MFQSLLSQLENHGAGTSTKDANKKFHRSRPSSWFQVSLIMRTKLGVYTLSFDDLYNNLRVFESNVKGSIASSSRTQNAAFVSSNSTNEVSTASGVSTSSGHNSQKEEEKDLKWQVAMISTRLKKFYKKTGRKLHFDAKEPVGFDKTKVECFNCHNTGHFPRERRTVKLDKHKAMVTIDGEGVDWNGHAGDDIENYALIAFNSSNSGLDTEVTYCSKVCEESYAKLKKLYNEQREQLGVASIKIQAYTLALKKGIYMPPKSNFRIDESKFTYGPKQSKTSESDAKTNVLSSCESNCSVETLESVPKPVKSKPKAVSKPKVWSDAPIIEEYESESDDEYEFKASVEKEKPSCAFINIVRHVKTPRQTVKDQDTCSQNTKVPKRDWTSLMSKRLGLGYGYTRKACFVRGNKAYLIEYQDFIGGPIAFGGSKGHIIVSQMCDKKNKVLFTDTECLVLSFDFMLPDENQVLLRVPRQNNMYNFNLENIIPSGGLACLIAKLVTIKNKANITAGPKEANNSAGIQNNIDARNTEIEAKHVQEYMYCHYGLLILQLSIAQKQRTEMKSLLGILV